jgi:hypothetical protein
LSAVAYSYDQAVNDINWEEHDTAYWERMSKDEISVSLMTAAVALFAAAFVTGKELY